MNTSIFDIDLKMGFKCFYKYIIDGINHKLCNVRFYLWLHNHVTQWMKIEIYDRGFLNFKNFFKISVFSILFAIYKKVLYPIGN